MSNFDYLLTIQSSGWKATTSVVSRSMKATEEERARAMNAIDAEVAAQLEVADDINAATRAIMAHLSDDKLEEGFYTLGPPFPRICLEVKRVKEGDW